MRGRGVGDERAVSESMSVAVLLTFTLLLTASLGAAVLLLDVGGSPGVEGSFSFQHLEQSSSMVINFDDGDQLVAGEVVVSGPAGNVTWAELAGTNETSPLMPGDAVQVSEASAYGADVTSRDEFQVLHAPEEGERVVLGSSE